MRRDSPSMLQQGQASKRPLRRSRVGDCKGRHREPSQTVADSQSVWTWGLGGGGFRPFVQRLQRHRRLQRHGTGATDTPDGDGIGGDGTRAPPRRGSMDRTASTARRAAPHPHARPPVRRSCALPAPIARPWRVAVVAVAFPTTALSAARAPVVVVLCFYPTVQVVARQQRYPATFGVLLLGPPCAVLHLRDPAVRDGRIFYQESSRTRPKRWDAAGVRAASGGGAALLPATRRPSPQPAFAVSAAWGDGCRRAGAAVSRSRRLGEKVTRVPTRAQGHPSSSGTTFSSLRTSFSSEAGHPFRSWD
jgi:hypothetical protein